MPRQSMPRAFFRQQFHLPNSLRAGQPGPAPIAPPVSNLLPLSHPRFSRPGPGTSAPSVETRIADAPPSPPSGCFAPRRPSPTNPAFYSPPESQRIQRQNHTPTRTSAPDIPESRAEFLPPRASSRRSRTLALDPPVRRYLLAIATTPSDTRLSLPHTASSPAQSSLDTYARRQNLDPSGWCPSLLLRPGCSPPPDNKQIPRSR